MKIPWPESDFVRFVLSLFIGLAVIGTIASLTESQVCVPTPELRWNGATLEQFVRCHHPYAERWEQVR